MRKRRCLVSYESLFSLDIGVTYDLRSVMVHYGEAGFGHYVAYVRAQNNMLYLCNDAAPPIRCPVADALNSKDAYMLFYERR